MAQTTQISFSIDDDVKRSAEQALNDMGLSMSAAITVFLKKIGRERCIPFEITADPFYSASNLRHLRAVINDIETGKARLEEHDLLEAGDE